MLPQTCVVQIGSLHTSLAMTITSNSIGHFNNLPKLLSIFTSTKWWSKSTAVYILPGRPEKGPSKDGHNMWTVWW